ncbi:uncharacterized protein FA14DRAFT_61896 [Meira miltonrushii]|uniref:Uncharacterized protein n=1 Tax=Meira miltonrushii TaxID=1280837 RepID=A0A316V7I0_9BASI|nr:uncharacterized protein FA14DRAFT_61896 [Meira miltonrushii]PWN33402.1 hypothetical protein FA14DRAFT_61896 [Meira miltonrushii]
MLSLLLLAIPKALNQIVGNRSIVIVKYRGLKGESDPISASSLESIFIFDCSGELTLSILSLHDFWLIRSIFVGLLQLFSLSVCVYVLLSSLGCMEYAAPRNNQRSRQDCVSNN